MSTDQEMAPARNATDAHTQYFMVNDELLVPILKASAHCTHLLHATRNAWCFQSVWNSRTVCRFQVIHINSSPPHRARHSNHRAEIISCSVFC